MLIRKFDDLPIWKLSLVITKKIYDLTFKDKFLKDFGLRDQLRRAIQGKRWKKDLLKELVISNE